MITDGKKTQDSTNLAGGWPRNDRSWTEMIESIGLQGLSSGISLHEDRTKPHARNYHRYVSTILVLGAQGADVGVASARPGMLVLEHGLYRRVKVFDS